jgi:ATP-dependent DNA helicase RecG
MDDNELLQSARLRGRDLETGQEGFNLAAALLLGKDDIIAVACPAYKTDAILRRRNLDRYDDRLVVKTNLIDSYNLLTGFCNKHLSDPFYLEGHRTVSLRGIIVRELVSNILVHREFTSPFPAKLIIENEGIHTENASRALFEGQLTLSDFNPMPKNPIIADFFTQIGLAEELGSGMKNLFKYSREYMGADPVMVEGDIFRTFIPNTHQDAPIPNTETDDKNNGKQDVRSVIDFLLQKNDTTTVSEVAKVAGITNRTASRHLKEMIEQGLLRAEGATRNRRYFKA